MIKWLCVQHEYEIEEQTQDEQNKNTTHITDEPATATVN